MPPLPPPPPMSSGGTEAARCHKLQKKKKYHVLNVSVYEGKCDKMKQHVYNIVLGKNGFDVFAKTATKIGKYIVQTIPTATKFALLMRPVDLGFTVIPVLPMPAQQNDLMELEIWRIANKCYNDLVEKQEENKRRAYTIVWGQCLLPVQDQVRASANYQQVNNNLDLIELL
jgi:hypothetical protein